MSRENRRSFLQRTGAALAMGWTWRAGPAVVKWTAVFDPETKQLKEAADIIDGQPEPLETAARRELLEETGYQADRLEYLFAGPPSPGISNEILTFYYAPDVERVAEGGGTDADEDIHVHTVPLASIENWLQQ